MLIPLLSRLLETGDVPASTNGAPEVRLAAARESLEAMIAIGGFTRLDPEALTMLERALEDLAGFVEVSGEDTVSLRIQFPMARALRSFLIVEAAGQRLALPWSAVDRVDATCEPEVEGDDAAIPALSLDLLFASSTARRSTVGEPAQAARPVALLRSGGRSTRVTFDRIVWRESARWTPLPPQLKATDEVLGGIVAPDGAITLVLSPAAIADRARAAAAGAGSPEVAA
jgi:chemotaxis protein histidine kinase CheA